MHLADYRVEGNRGPIYPKETAGPRPDDDSVPYVYVSTQKKGIKLTHQFRASFVLGVPIEIARHRGLIISALVILACGLLMSSVWLAAGVSMIVGLCAQILGAVEYKAERWLKAAIAG